MNREIHVRICEGVGVRFPRATRLLPLLGMFILGPTEEGCRYPDSSAFLGYREVLQPKVACCDKLCTCPKFLRGLEVR